MESDLKKNPSNEGIIVVGQVAEPEKIISGVNDNDTLPPSEEASVEEPDVAE